MKPAAAQARAEIDPAYPHGQPLIRPGRRPPSWSPPPGHRGPGRDASLGRRPRAAPGNRIESVHRTALTQWSGRPPAGGRRSGIPRHRGCAPWPARRPAARPWPEVDPDQPGTGPGRDLQPVPGAAAGQVEQHVARPQPQFPPISSIAISGTMPACASGGSPRLRFVISATWASRGGVPPVEVFGRWASVSWTYWIRPQAHAIDPPRHHTGRKGVTGHFGRGLPPTATRRRPENDAEAPSRGGA